MISKEEKIKIDASKAYKFDLKLKSGGLALTHTPSFHGIALKWLIHTKGYTYGQFAKLYNGTTAQNMNHLINRIDERRYFDEDLEKMCKILKISTDYLHKLCEEIAKLSERDDG